MGVLGLMTVCVLGYAASQEVQCVQTGYHWNSDGALTDEEWGGVVSSNIFKPQDEVDGLDSRWQSLKETEQSAAEDQLTQIDMLGRMESQRRKCDTYKSKTWQPGAFLLTGPARLWTPRAMARILSSMFCVLCSVLDVRCSVFYVQPLDE